ncbi:hypothetical protein C9374_010493 [Naegleria lovaniensis]|uniref:Homologous-pairing protein 2 homolog n=1 Tax=Naegleria lovaniensis TaxID=51637 RepID=A0AA88KFS7_NAELO|nr:uncharacterized protein C9374_010493 [Naegleria lovaniensis]KAG2374749.1 hypothetical protein C9374_010493 [Naegleria lovaniensis]
MAGKRKRASAAENDEDYSGAAEEESRDTQESNKEEPSEKEEEASPKPKEKKKKTKKKESTASTKKASSSAGKKSTTASSKKGSKPVIKSESEARNMILEYMKAQNRPYSLQQVIDNLGGQIKKAMATKCIDKLEQEGELVLKANGKQKLWYRNQTDLEVLSKEELKEIDNDIKDIQKDIAAVKSDNQKRASELARIQKAPTTVQLVSIVATQREELAAKKQKLEKLESGSIQLVSPEEKKKALVDLDKYLKEWKKRKNLAMSIFDSCSETCETNPSELLEEIGMDTDESVGVDMKTMGRLY